MLFVFIEKIHLAVDMCSSNPCCSSLSCKWIPVLEDFPPPAFPDTIYGFNSIPAGIFKILSGIWKFTWKCKGIGIAKTVLKRKKSCRTHTAWCESDHKAVVKNTPVIKNRPMKHSKEKYTHTSIVPGFLTKVQRHFSGETFVLSINSAETTTWWCFLTWALTSTCLISLKSSLQS